MIHARAVKSALKLKKSCNWEGHSFNNTTGSFTFLFFAVAMEAYSVEDNGRLSYHVFVYNVQPGIELDYATGRNWLKK